MEDTIGYPKMPTLMWKIMINHRIVGKKRKTGDKKHEKRDICMCVCVEYINPSHTAQRIFMRSRAVDLDWVP